MRSGPMPTTFPSRLVTTPPPPLLPRTATSSPMATLLVKSVIASKGWGGGALRAMRMMSWPWATSAGPSAERDRHRGAP